MIPVQISTTWYNFDPSQSFEHTPYKLSEAVQNGNVMNISMFVPFKELTENETIAKNENREWIIGEFLILDFFSDSLILIYSKQKKIKNYISTVNFTQRGYCSM